MRHTHHRRCPIGAVDTHRAAAAAGPLSRSGPDLNVFDHADRYKRMLPTIPATRRSSSRHGARR